MNVNGISIIESWIVLQSGYVDLKGKCCVSLRQWAVTQLTHSDASVRYFFVKVTQQKWRDATAIASIAVSVILKQKHLIRAGWTRWPRSFAGCLLFHICILFVMGSIISICSLECIITIRTPFWVGWISGLMSRIFQKPRVWYCRWCEWEIFYKTTL